MARILVADDDRLLLELTERALRRRGHEVDLFSDGESAALALEHREAAYDLAIVDLRMPRRSGLEVLAAARRAQPETPVVMVSCTWSEDDREAAEAGGAFAVLEKPVALERLYRVVDRALAERTAGGKPRGEAGLPAAAAPPAPGAHGGAPQVFVERPEIGGVVIGALPPEPPALGSPAAGRCEPRNGSHLPVASPGGRTGRMPPPNARPRRRQPSISGLLPAAVSAERQQAGSCPRSLQAPGGARWPGGAELCPPATSPPAAGGEPSACGGTAGSDTDALSPSAAVAAIDAILERERAGTAALPTPELELALAPPHVLVVEPDACLRNLVGYCLRRQGYRVDAVEALAAALEQLALELPDLAVIGVPPGATGLGEVLQALRRHHGTGGPPVLVVHEAGATADAVYALEAGADVALARPYDPEVLFAHVRALLRRHGGAAAGLGRAPATTDSEEEAR
ncbi:MAG: hypothetical protein KatS3mg102_2458 [Planctomycetota bacterium]|nr:MAG: hypothetical protein KatS3mg102_2458 [Planctomycetota bacterium]